MSSSRDRAKLAQQYEKLVHAARAGDLQRVTELIDGADSPHELINARFSYGSPGMSPTHARGRMRMPLLEASGRPNNVAVLQRLLNCGANVDDHIDDGRTALQFAAGDDNVNVLLQHGADLCQALSSPWHFKMDSRRPRLMKMRIHSLFDHWRRAVRVLIISMLWRHCLHDLFFYVRDYLHGLYRCNIPGIARGRAAFEVYQSAVQHAIQQRRRQAHH
uniref:Ankyrin repeat domain-containing protein n=1 Tax=Coccolithus braarudii TaxID=221442 RepID=A0A7S0PZZ6_9EUKA|mmetsp:Transcript_27346/g.58897  ORF Transcript_27346/g.58897 Transcript_27346/m.58897 type:complete len:218 (+) Transcript_27346:37-690(+)